MLLASAGDMANARASNRSVRAIKPPCLAAGGSAMERAEDQRCVGTSHTSVAVGAEHFRMRPSAGQRDATPPIPHTWTPRCTALSYRVRNPGAGPAGTGMVALRVCRHEVGQGAEGGVLEQQRRSEVRLPEFDSQFTHQLSGGDGIQPSIHERRVRGSLRTPVVARPRCLESHRYCRRHSSPRPRAHAGSAWRKTSHGGSCLSFARDAGMIANTATTFCAQHEAT